MLLGNTSNNRCLLTSTGLSPSTAPLSNGLRLHTHQLRHTGRCTTNGPTTPPPQPLPGITRRRFGLFRVRSPLLTESLLFSLPTGTEMFHFPAFPPNTLFHSGAGNWTQLQLGFPIRTSPDQRSVANSPGLIAGSYVLHRLSMPRHPPCALTNLPQQTTNTHNKHTRASAAAANTKASDTKQSKTQHSHYKHHHQPLPGPASGACSRPLSRNQTTRTPQTQTPTKETQHPGVPEVSSV